MGIFRRRRLGATALFLITAGCVGHTSPQPEAALRLEAGSGSGTLIIRNTGSAEVSLHPDFAVEHLADGKWSRTGVKLRLMDSCKGDGSGSTCLRVPPGGSYAPLRWSGADCAAQCPEPCRGTLYYGPGKFRFVLRDCKTSATFTGPEFTLPKHPE